MCLGGSPKVDNRLTNLQIEEARRAREEEEARQGRIRAGNQKIDQVFSGFTPAFYDTRFNDFMAFYQPQLDDRIQRARSDLTFALNDAGLLNSTVAADKVADLNKEYDTQRASIISRGKNDVDSFKGRIANEKAALVSQLNATGDADRISNEATARTQQLFREIPEYSPLGDIFGGLASGIGSYASRLRDDAIYSAAGLSSPRRNPFSLVT